MVRYTYDFGQPLGVVNHIVNEAFAEVRALKYATFLGVGIDLVEETLSCGLRSGHPVREADHQPAAPPFLR